MLYVRKAPEIGIHRYFGNHTSKSSHVRDITTVHQGLSRIMKLPFLIDLNDFMP